MKEARTKARALRKRGDLLGARRVLEEALPAAKGLDKDALRADLSELGREIEALATVETGGAAEAAPESESVEVPSLADEDGLVGRSPALVKLRAEIVRAAKSDAPLAITGPPGCGKELVARAVHRRSRAKEPFVAVAPAALSPGLVEAELFGHAAGSFTGAAAAREGLLVAAGRGTLLLDRVDEVSADVQAKLLRALETRTVRPVGGAGDVPLRARVIATARRPLSALVRDGVLREDLRYRLEVLAIDVPPLRERKDDVKPLVRALLAKHAGDRPVPKLAPDAMKALVAYPWPGNVQELENELRRLLVLGANPIVPACLAPAIRSGKAPSELDLSTGTYDRLRGKTLAEVERKAILAALRSCDGNRSRAAKLLGVSRRALYDKMKRFGVE